MIYILGGGLSGLIVANYFLKVRKITDFKIITLDDHGFAFNRTKDFDFKLAQRTMFFDDKFSHFLNDVIIFNGLETDFEDLSDNISVYFKGKLHKYPIQNNLGELDWKDKLAFYWDYFNRKKSKYNDYLHWAISNYGQWMAENILIPHTWKTLKDDLTRINSDYYGKKVIKLNLLRKKKQLCFKYPDNIINMLRDNVKDYIIKGKVTDIKFDPNLIYIDNVVNEPLSWKTIVNTIPLPKFMDVFDFKDDEIMEVAQLSLQWNNMFLGVFIVPSKMVNTFKKIIYFPEPDFMFSKIEIDRKNGYTVICCECSFRRNDEDKFKCKPYLQEYLNKIENDLIKAKIINSSIISTYYKDYRIISPAYIIPDSDYKQCNDFIQAWMNHRKIYNIGRFAEWLPWMRIEHSYENCDKLFNENDGINI